MILALITLFAFLAGLLTYMYSLPIHRGTLKRWGRTCVHCLYRTLGLHLIPQRHRRTIHVGILFVIAYDLISVGAKLADLGFLFLSFLMEAENALTHDEPIDRHAWLPGPVIDKLAAQIAVWRQTLPQPPQQKGSIILPDPSCYWTTLETFARAQGFRVYLRASEIPPLHPSLNFNDGARAFSSVYFKMIAFDSINDTSFRVYLMVHELGHVLNSDFVGHSRGRQYAELYAELTTLLLFNRLGWDDGYAMEYLAGYTPPIQGETRAIIDSISTAVLPTVDRLYRVITEAPCHAS